MLKGRPAGAEKIVPPPFGILFRGSDLQNVPWSAYSGSSNLPRQVINIMICCHLTNETGSAFIRSQGYFDKIYFDQTTMNLIAKKGDSMML